MHGINMGKQPYLQTGKDFHNTDVRKKFRQREQSFPQSIPKLKDAFRLKTRLRKKI